MDNSRVRQGSELARRPNVQSRAWPAVVSSMLAILLLMVSGCTSAVLERGDDGGRSAGGTAGPWKPVAVPGVPSCRSLARMAGVASQPSDSALDSIELPCLTPGPAADLAKLRGRPVLVNMWASWCGPCRDEMPILTAAHERLGDQVQFLGVNTADAPRQPPTSSKSSRPVPAARRPQQRTARPTPHPRTARHPHPRLRRHPPGKAHRAV